MKIIYVLSTLLLLAACGIKGDLTRPSDIKQNKEKPAVSDGLF